MTQYDTHHTALIIVDVQNGFLNEKTSKILPRIEELLEQDFETVIITDFFNTPNSRYVKYLDWDKVARTDEIETPETIREHADYIIRKDGYMCVDSIISILEDKNINTVLIVGLNSDECVLFNAAGLFDNDYHVFTDMKALATSSGLNDETVRLLFQRVIGKDQVLG